MRNCLLCETIIKKSPSWQSLLNCEEEKIICESCSKSFERADSISKTTYLSSVLSLYTYNEAMRNYLHQFKFLQDIALAAVFQKELTIALTDKHNIIPIPVHKEKRVARTFGQVEALLDYAKIPYENKLEKRDQTVMGEKKRQERLKMAPLFHLTSNADIQRQTYTLVDDIYTTGTTLDHAAKVLLEAGAKEVVAVTLIRA